MQEKKNNMKKNERQSLTANKQIHEVKREKWKTKSFIQTYKNILHNGGNIIIILLPIYSFEKFQNVHRQC